MILPLPKSLVIILYFVYLNQNNVLKYDIIIKDIMYKVLTSDSSSNN